MILRFCIFRLIFLLIEIIFAAILSVMRIVLEKYGKNVTFEHIAFCIVFFFSLNKFQFTCDLHDALNQKNNSSYDFSLKTILLQFWKNRIFC